MLLIECFILNGEYLFVYFYIFLFRFTINIRWLDKVGFWDIGPNRDGILFAPNANESSTMSTNMALVMATMFSVIFAVVGFVIGKKHAMQGSSRNGYSSIGNTFDL